MRFMRACLSSEGISKSLADHLRHLVGVVGVDQQGVRQFAAGSSKLTEDQDTVLVFPGSDKLFWLQDSCRHAVK